MGFNLDLKSDLTVLKSLLKPRRPQGSADFLEQFYGSQSHVYDEFRKKLLRGRQEMMETIDWAGVSTWVDFGAGTGFNLSYVPTFEHLKKIHLVDLSPSLLGVARERAEKMDFKNIEIVTADICTFTPPKKVDLVTFSYSLTMVPDWFKAVENAYRILKPGGHVAVVDFFVGRKWSETTDHSFLTRTLWPLWFAYDNVFINPDHLPFLKDKFGTQYCDERQTKLPYLPPFLKVPYYIFIGEKRA